MDRLNITTLCPQGLIKLVQPVLLGYLLRYFESYDPNDYHGLQLAFCYGLGISLCTLLMVLENHLFIQCLKMAMKIRVALSHMIYKKVSLLDGARGSGCGFKQGVVYLWLARNSGIELELGD